MSTFMNTDPKAFSGVWVFCEQRQGKMMPTTFELISEGRKLADELGVQLSGILLGDNVINPDDVFPTLQKVFNADGPALVNIMTDPNALAMPPKIEFSQMLGFAQTMYKLMMEGRSKEVLDTIDTNLKHWKEVF